MDTGIIIIGIFLTLLVVSPFVLLKDKGKKAREKRLGDALIQLAKSNGLSITASESWNSTTIGIDKDKKIVLFVKNPDNDIIETVVSLSGIKRCKVSIKHHSSEFHNSTVKVIDTISLSLESYQKGLPDVILEFYNDTSDNLTLSGELQLAQKWSEIINNEINSNVRQKIA